MKKLWIYGAGGHARVVYEMIKLLGTFDIVGFIDDDKDREGENFLGCTIISGIKKFEDFNKKLKAQNIFIAIGDNLTREKLAERMGNYAFPTVIHSTAVVSRDAKIGVGSIIMPGVVIEPQVEIGRHCILNNGAIVGHSSTVGDFCHISGNAVVSGEVTVGDASFVGIGACITPRTTVGQRCVLAAGSVITRDIPDGVQMFGNPARVLSKHLSASGTWKT